MAGHAPSQVIVVGVVPESCDLGKRFSLSVLNTCLVARYHRSIGCAAVDRLPKATRSDPEDSLVVIQFDLKSIQLPCALSFGRATAERCRSGGEMGARRHPRRLPDRSRRRSTPSLNADRGGCSTRVIYEAWRFFLKLVLLEHHATSIQSVMVRDCWPLDISGCDGFSSGVCNAGEAWPLGTFFVGRSAALGRRFGTFASTCS